MREAETKQIELWVVQELYLFLLHLMKLDDSKVNRKIMIQYDQLMRVQFEKEYEYKNRKMNKKQKEESKVLEMEMFLMVVVEVVEEEV